MHWTGFMLRIKEGSYTADHRNTGKEVTLFLNLMCFALGKKEDTKI